MYCSRCGRATQAEDRFCPSCGAPLGVPSPPVAAAAPVAPTSSRMESHVKLLGILLIVYNSLHLLAALAFILGLGIVGRIVGELNLPFGVGELLRVLLPVLVGLLLAVSALGILGGAALLQHDRWGRMLVIVLSCINLLRMPVGTALGIYGLWVLMSAEGEAYYRRVAT